MQRMRTVTIAVAVVLAAGWRPVQGQQSRFAGVWSVRYTRQVTHMHSPDTTLVDESAQMILRQRGDSVFGYWQFTPDNGENAGPPRTVRGVVVRETARVQIDQPPHDDDGFFSELGRDIVEWIKTHVHDMPTMVPLLEFTVRGDSIV